MHEMMYQTETDYYFDSSKFEQHFGWSATTYEEGLKATLASIL
jgi:nucleoside-diphosphate-sugar epimerase